MNHVILSKDELMHHGVLGMKWGVRRYQNYDGTYTKKGMEHYRESEAKYKEAKQRHKAIKAGYKETKKYGSVEVNGKKLAFTKDLVKDSKRDLKAKKKQLSRDYDQLKRDKAGDKGKELYRSGKTIIGGNQKVRLAASAAVGMSLVSYGLAENGNNKLAAYTGAMSTGMALTAAALRIKNERDAHYLRAYYSHNRPNR